ncbi:MAG: hypothetical protein HY906_27940 [Deltaproteobacteria bacterium]|nr:hypothetical protein [Deltaproteobacteria bacterium]
MMKTMVRVLGLTALPLLAAVCSSDHEPATLPLPVVARGGGLSAFVTAEGYTVELAELRVALGDLQFTVGGETHAGLLRDARRALVREAFAHPGHYAGGEVTGQLAGAFIIDAFAPGEVALGTATLLEGDYHGANFTFRAASTEDGLAADDPLLGHTALMAGTASRAGAAYTFHAVLDIDAGTQMVGAPFTLALRAGAGATLALAVLAVDPSTEGDSLLDGVDFAALDPDGNHVVEILPGDAAHNIIRRTLQVHDHWWVDVR